MNLDSLSKTLAIAGCALALGFALAPASCLRADIEATGAGGNGGTGGTGGSLLGIGGGGGAIDAGLGGSGDDGGAGGGTGGNGMGGNGSGGMITGMGGDGGTGLTPNAPGQLVITEIMADTAGPPDESGEWFELYNPSTTETYDLYGCLLYDSNTSPTGQDMVMRHIMVAPGAYATMARFGDATGGFVPDYNYHTSTLADNVTPDPNKDVKLDNSGDLVGITCGLTVIDQVNFMSWISPPPPAAGGAVPHGRSYNLDPSHLTATENDVEANWCTGTILYGAGQDRGTPAMINSVCACMLGANPATCLF